MYLSYNEQNVTLPGVDANIVTIYGVILYLPIYAIKYVKCLIMNLTICESLYQQFAQKYILVILHTWGMYFTVCVKYLKKPCYFFYCFIYIHILYYNFSFWFLIITVNAWTEEAFIFLFLFLQNSFYYYYYLILYSFLLQNIFNYCKIVNDLWEAFFFLLFFIIIIL